MDRTTAFARELSVNRWTGPQPGVPRTTGGRVPTTSPTTASHRGAQPPGRNLRNRRRADCASCATGRVVRLRRPAHPPSHCAQPQTSRRVCAMSTGTHAQPAATSPHPPVPAGIAHAVNGPASTGGPDHSLVYPHHGWPSPDHTPPPQQVTGLRSHPAETCATGAGLTAHHAQPAHKVRLRRPAHPLKPLRTAADTQGTHAQ